MIGSTGRYRYSSVPGMLRGLGKGKKEGGRRAFRRVSYGMFIDTILAQKRQK